MLSYSKSLEKIVKGILVGIISGLIPFLFINLILIIENKEISIFIDLFKSEYRPVLLKLLEITTMVSLAGGTIGALVGGTISLLGVENKKFIKKVYMWNIFRYCVGNGFRNYNIP